MKEHPPLCPKADDPVSMPTDEVWFICNKDRTLGFEINIQNPTERRMFARYQACAWMDRAERYSKIKRFGWANDATMASVMCRRNARAWREWEKSHD